MPVSKLKTPAGVDHDYNFLSGIERERDRNQREVVEEKGLFTQREVREIDNEKRWRKMWFGEEVRFVAAGKSNYVMTRGLGSDSDEEEQHGGGKMSHIARKIRARLEHTGTQVVQMPAGMVRQRENTTAWNRRTGGINWCVEWVMYEPENKSMNEAGLKKSTQIRHKALESVPLYKALGNSLAWHRRGLAKGEDQDDDEADEMALSARKRRRVLIREVKEESRHSAMQDYNEAVWCNTPYPTQNPYTSAWDADRGATVSSWFAEAEIDARRSHRFYLLKPMTPAGKSKELIPLDSAETLSSALQGRTVLEYPTVYILPPLPPSSSENDVALHLPENHILSSTERRASQPRRTKAEKRKAPDQNNKTDGPTQKRQALSGSNAQQRGGGRGGRGGAVRGRGRGGRVGRELIHTNRQRGSDAEEGEINSGGDDVAADTTSSDSDTQSDEEGSFDFNHGQERRMNIDPSVGATSNAPLDPSTTVIGKMVHFVPQGQPEKTGLGLVDYGSDSDEDGEVDQEDVDISKLNPENPELVAGAIQEIVGLLS